jgi:sodium transport system permease protein
VNRSNVATVLRKELRETLRDRRTLLVMLVVPIFLYPVLLVVIEQLVLFGRRSIEERPVTVAVSGATPAAAAFLERDTAMRVRRTASVDPRAVGEGRVDAAVVFRVAPGESGTARARVVYDASRDRSRSARDRVRERLGEWGDTLLAQRLRSRSLPSSFAVPVEVADSSVASAEQLGGYAVGRFLPALLILMTLLGCFYPAIDLTAGEKERGTLETLLTTPVPAREVVAGKFVTVCLLGMAAAGLNVVSMLLTFESGVFQLSRATGLKLELPLSAAVLVLLFILPLAVFFAALFLGIAVRAQSFKEAQNALTPVQFAMLIPIYLPLIPGIPLSYAVALVPVGGIAVLFRDLMAGGAPVGPAAVAVLAMVAYALLALRFAASAFGREEVLFGSGGHDEALGWRARLAAWRSSGAAVPRPATALAFAAVVALLYFYVGVRLQLVSLERGLLLSQFLLLALPALLLVRLGPYRAGPTLGLRPASPRAFGAAVLVIAGAIPLGWAIAWLQSLVFDVPPELLRGLSKFMTADSPGRFVQLLLLVAVTPAICEELVFRGVVLRGLSNGLSRWRAVVGSAAIFAAFHLSLETAIRFLPTLWLGLLIAHVAWNTRSIFPGMLMHFLNNGAVLALVGAPALRPYLLGPEGQPRWALVAAGAAVLALGLRLLPSREPHEPGPARPPVPAALPTPAETR